MYRSIKVVGVSVAALSVTTAVLAPNASAAAPSSQDKTFVMGNEQVNLAEITIGTLALQRAHTQTAKSLATKTISDHRAAMAKLTALAAKEGITLPTAPNAVQQAQAATLKTVSAAKFDLAYVTAQVAGHRTSIAATDTELSGGSDSAVLAYAKYYLPVAKMHLVMADDGVKTLLGSPASVPAGTGGQAAVTSAGAVRNAWLEGVAGLVLAAAAGAGLLGRRRRAGVPA